MSAPLTLLESADLLGRYRFVEMASFEALGRRVITAEAPETQRFLAGASLAHGWRARVVEERLPVSVGLPGTEACTRSPSPSVERAIALVVGEGGDAAVLDALVHALYPAMSMAYRVRIAAAYPAPDGPVVRALGRIVADLDATTSAAFDLLARRRGDDRTSAVRELLDAAGGPFGPLVDRR